MSDAVLSQPRATTTAVFVLVAISFCHMLNDMMQALLPAIYPILRSTFNLTFAQVGLLTLTYQIVASILQPLIGFYTDRRPQSYFLPLAMLALLGMQDINAMGAIRTLLAAAINAAAVVTFILSHAVLWPPCTVMVATWETPDGTGTLSGAPKFKAMELIDQYEPTARSYYGGCIGFIGFDGSCNHAIMIRSLLSRNNTLTYQAGAGIVAASQPESELQEVNNKLGALKSAIASGFCKATCSSRLPARPLTSWFPIRPTSQQHTAIRSLLRFAITSRRWLCLRARMAWRSIGA